MDFLFLMVVMIFGFLLSFLHDRLVENDGIKLILLMFLIFLFFYSFFDFIASFENFLIPFGLILLMILIIFIGNKIYLKNNIKDIFYYRDIPSDFTPLEVSYLINNCIDIRKDFSAVFVDLINRGIVSIKEDKGINRLVLNKYDEIVNEDEKYLVDWYFNSKHKNYSIKELEDIILNNLFKKNVYINKRRTPFGSYMVLIIALPIVIYGILAVYGVVDRQLYLSRAIFFFFLAIVLLVFNGMNQNTKIYKLSKEGKENYKKILSFKNFLKSFSNIKNINLKENKLWDKYFVYATVLNINKSYLGIYSNFYEKLDYDIFKNNLNVILEDFEKTLKNY